MFFYVQFHQTKEKVDALTRKHNTPRGAALPGEQKKTIISLSDQVLSVSYMYHPPPDLMMSFDLMLLYLYVCAQYTYIPSGNLCK